MFIHNSKFLCILFFSIIFGSYFKNSCPIIDSYYLDDGRQFITSICPVTGMLIHSVGLYSFAYRNLEQMKQIGSNKNVEILVHLDIPKPSSPSKITHRINLSHENRTFLLDDFIFIAQEKKENKQVALYCASPFQHLFSKKN